MLENWQVVLIGIQEPIKKQNCQFNNALLSYLVVNRREMLTITNVRLRTKSQVVKIDTARRHFTSFNKIDFDVYTFQGAKDECILIKIYGIALIDNISRK